MVSRLLLIISGSIAAYKSLELIRLLHKDGIEVTAILTEGGAQFITPLAVSALTGRPTYTDLWSLKDEVEMGHIRLSREADLILVAPASADLMARMAQGRADDLASTTLLASDKPIFLAPAMNAQMWKNAATQRNLTQLKEDGVHIIAPGSGEMACGEVGDGRMAEPDEILAFIHQFATQGPLSGRHAIVTAGPTFEPLDPVRFLGNRSSGKQGYAIAEALARRGANVTLVSGPTALPAPRGVTRIEVETAQQMHDAVMHALPADLFIGTAAVADWRPAQPTERKLKKRGNAEPPHVSLTENPDILAGVAQHATRPDLVIGFAAETENLEESAAEKRQRKQIDWVIANDVSGGAIFGADHTSLLVVTETGSERWEQVSKYYAAEKLAEKITARLTATTPSAKQTRGRVIKI
jgi:phosphopantothenoylcysteine decarboxylase/phosphopantothenate--cysteine ligase